MKILKLKRTHCLDKLTLGILDIENIPFCLTLEPPWRNNKVDESCIPVGEYLCKRIVSPKFGETFEIIVQNRTIILFHKGNYITETKGCVLINNGFLESEYFGLSDSGIAFSRFMRYLKGENEFKLVITEV